jgi:uncharacterized protein (DUF2062 family)
VSKYVKKRKFWPSKEELKTHKWLKFLHAHMHHSFLWHFDRKGVCRSCIIGMFMCMMPMPFQMVPAAIFSFVFRANLIVSVALVWISNPITMLPMMYGAYWFGCFMLGMTPVFHQHDFVWHDMVTQLHMIIVPLITGCVIIGLVGGLLLASLAWLGFTFVKRANS